MDWHGKKKPNTDDLSVYDLPALNALIDQYEPPKMKGVDPKPESGQQIRQTGSEDHIS